MSTAPVRPVRTTFQPHRLLRMEFDSHPAHVADVRRAVETFAAQAGLGEQAACDCGLCVNEALANVIRHAYANRPDRPIELSVQWDGEAIRILVRDWGSGVDPSRFAPCEVATDSATAPATDAGAAVPEPGGIGLICLDRLMDEVVYTPQPDGMLLAMTRHARQPTPPTDQDQPRRADAGESA